MCAARRGGQRLRSRSPSPRRPERVFGGRARAARARRLGRGHIGVETGRLHLKTRRLPHPGSAGVKRWPSLLSRDQSQWTASPMKDVMVAFGVHIKARRRVRARTAPNVRFKPKGRLDPDAIRRRSDGCDQMADEQWASHRASADRVVEIVSDPECFALAGVPLWRHCGLGPSGGV